MLIMLTMRAIGSGRVPVCAAARRFLTWRFILAAVWCRCSFWNEVFFSSADAGNDSNIGSEQFAQAQPAQVVLAAYSSIIPEPMLTIQLTIKPYGSLTRGTSWLTGRPMRAAAGFIGGFGFSECSPPPYTYNNFQTETFAPDEPPPASGRTTRMSSATDKLREIQVKITPSGSRASGRRRCIWCRRR